MRTKWLACGVALLILATEAPARADADAATASALSHVPSNAVVVAQIRGIERAKDRLIALVRNAAPDLAQSVQTQIDENLKKAIHERELKGVSRDGSILFVLTQFPTPDQDIPTAAVLLPVSNYAEFRDALIKESERPSVKKEAGYESFKNENTDRTDYLVDHHGYAVITPSKSLATRFTKSFKGLDGKLDQETARKLVDADAAVYVDMTAVNEQYGDQIQGMKNLFPLVKAQLRDAAKLDESTIAMLQSFYEGTFQVFEDSKGFLLAADFRPEGLALQTALRVGGDTSTGSFMKAARSGPATDLDKLPRAQLGYVTVHLSPELARTYFRIVTGALGKDAKPELKEALQQLNAAGPERVVMDFNLPASGLQVWSYKDPAKAVDAQLKLFQALGSGSSFQNGFLKDKPKIDADQQQAHDVQFHSVQLTWDFDKMAERLGPAGGGKNGVPAMKKLLGEGVNLWIGSDGKHMISASGKDWETARHQIDTYLDGTNTVSDQPAFTASLAQLPKQATLLSLVDLPLYIQRLAAFLAPMLKDMPMAAPFAHLKAESGKTYLGVAFTLQSERGSFDLWVPVTTFKEVRRMIRTHTPAETDEVQ